VQPLQRVLQQEWLQLALMVMLPQPVQLQRRRPPLPLTQRLKLQRQRKHCGCSEPRLLSQMRNNADFMPSLLAALVVCARQLPDRGEAD
jgi:hypothetical protein